MKRLLLNIVLLLCLSIPVLYLLNYATDEGLKKSKRGDYAQWNDIYHSRINANLLIMGASQAKNDLSPVIIDSVLHTRSYNLGLIQYRFSLQYLRLQVYLQHNIPPKYIIQVVDLRNLELNDELYSYEQFFPYLGDTLISNGMAQYPGIFTWPRLHFPLFKYNNHWGLVKEGLRLYADKKHIGTIDKNRGFELIGGEWDSSFSEFKKAYPGGISGGINTNVLHKFETYLDYCNRQHIKVMLVYAPVFYEEQPMEKNAMEIKDLYKKLALQYSATLLDYSHDTLSMNRKYFYNSQHLNYRGSAIFSAHLANDLRDIIQLPAGN